jgi:hypothetical protein
VDLITSEEIRRLQLERLELAEEAVRLRENYHPQEQDKRRSTAILYIKLFRTLTYILSRTGATTSEMVFDNYTPQFEAILDLVEELGRADSLPPAPLSLDMGVIPPLYYTLIYCRVLSIRRRAIELLRRAPYREGHWCREHALRYAVWKVATEERGRGDLPESSLLPDSARVYQADIPDPSALRGLETTIPVRVRYKKGSGDSTEVGEGEIMGDWDIWEIW